MEFFGDLIGLFAMELDEHAHSLGVCLLCAFFPCHLTEGLLLFCYTKVFVVLP